MRFRSVEVENGVVARRRSEGTLTGSRLEPLLKALCVPETAARWRKVRRFGDRIAADIAIRCRRIF